MFDSAVGARIARQEQNERDFEKRKLLERVREQDTVIRRLWDRYTQDVGHEPSLADIAASERRRFVPVRAEVLHHALEHRLTFEDAVEEFELQWTHCYAEGPTQRTASSLMHGKRPAVVSRRSGDLCISGYWGNGVSMPAFERLLQKLRGCQHGSLRRVDLSDNGLNGNFVPGLVEVLRRGVRQLDLSQNALESAAAQQLCNALPHVAPYLEVLDLRWNPCASDPAFLLCVAGVLPEMKLLDRLLLTVRTELAVTTSPRGDSVGSRSISREGRRRQASRERERESAAASSKPARLAGQPPAPQRRRAPRAASSSGLAEKRPANAGLGSGVGAGFGSGFGSGFGPPNPHAWRVRSMSRSSLGMSQMERGRSVTEVSSREVGTVLSAFGRDAAAGLFRALRQCSHLRALDLRSSQLQPNAVRKLAEFVRKDQLVVLSLADCFLGAVVEPILDAVSTCSRMVQLNLRLNAIRGHAGLKLCSALRTSVSLTEVDLASNDLGDDFGEAFASVLASNDVLWKADLARNPLGVRTGDALLGVLQKRNTSLVSIGDTTNWFDDLGYENRFQIQCYLDANRKGLESGGRVLGGLPPAFENLEFEVLDEDPVVEPLWPLLLPERDDRPRLSPESGQVSH